MLAGLIASGGLGLGADIFWVGDVDGNFATLSGGNSNWTTDVAGTTDYASAALAGQMLNFSAVGVAQLSIVNDIVGLSVGGITFLPPGGSFAGTTTVSGNALTLTGGITNYNTRAGREAILAADLILAADQT